MSSHAISAAAAIDRGALLDRFRRYRARSRQFFDLVTPEAYYSRPITLRNPVVFYEGHLAAFSVNTLLKKALGRAGDRPCARSALCTRDRSGARSARRLLRASWPPRGRSCICRGIGSAARGGPLERELDRPGPPVPRSRRGCVHGHRARGDAPGDAAVHLASSSARSEASAAGLSLATTARCRACSGCRSQQVSPRSAPARRRALRMGQRVRRCVDRRPQLQVDRHDVTNADFRAFVEDGGYVRESLWTPAAWQWRTAEHVTHPLFWERHDGSGSGAACSISFRCRPRGPCT